MSEHASTPVIAAEPDMEIDEGAQLMVRQGVRRLVVVEAGFLVGVVTLDDLAARVTDPASRHACPRASHARRCRTTACAKA